MTISETANQFIWAEKYRPTSIEECILSAETKKMALGYVEQGRVPHLIFSGGAGVGKTTLAKAMCNELGADWIIINGSSDNGIDVLRTKITHFASTVSFSDAKKVVIIDEADHLSPLFQAACRNFFEEFASNCSFILTCNFPKRIIDPIHSRCPTVRFNIPKEEKAGLASQFFKRILSILEAEGVEYDKKVVAELVQKDFPDFRRCLMGLQRYAASGKIDAGILVNVAEDSFKELVLAVKGKKFNDARKWVATNNDIDSARFFRMFYDQATDLMATKSLPELIMLISNYQYKASQVADQEINTMAFVFELMSSAIEWK